MILKYVLQKCVPQLNSITESKKIKSDSESVIDLLNKCINDFGNGAKSIVDDLTDYCDYLKETLDDLNNFLEEGDTSSCDSDLDLKGCDWARYMKSIHVDIEKSYIYIYCTCRFSYLYSIHKIIVRACIYIYIHIHIYVCMYVCMYICITLAL